MDRRIKVVRSDRQRPVVVLMDHKESVSLTAASRWSDLTWSTKSVSMDRRIKVVRSDMDHQESVSMDPPHQGGQI